MLSQNPMSLLPKRADSKAGFTAIGKQRYRCKNESCETKTFLQTYRYRGYSPRIKAQIIDMAINGSGIRGTARVLKVSQWLVMEEIKKVSSLRFVNEKLVLAKPISRK